MKKNLLIVASVIITSVTFGQNVAINSTGAAANASAALDVDMANKGILIPRVALTTTTAYAPVTGAATISLLVYNTATAGTFPTNVTPGYYYWNGTVWVRLINSGTAWELLGNQGTTFGTNFIGTLDNVGIDLRTNNTIRQRIYNTGETSFNGNAFAGDVVASYGSNDNFVLNSYLNGNGLGVGVFVSNANTNAGSVTHYSTVGATSAAWNGYFETNSTTNTRPAVAAMTANTAGNGVAAYVGAVSVTTYTGGAGGTFSHPTRGVYGVARNATNSTGGVFAGNNVAPTVLTTGSGASSVGTTTGFVALATTAANSVGAFISGNNTAYTGPATGGAGVAATGTILGTFSTATTAGNNNWGGYFANGNANGFAYVGGRTGGTDYKINGPGAVATMVDDLSGKKVNMFCPEAPEILFQDYGVGVLVNGKAHVKIDPILAKNIFVDDKHPLKVFIQLEGECNGVYVTSKSANGFDVIELSNGTSNVPFSWTIVANRIDTKNPDGTVDSKFQDVRFPDSPLKVESKEQERSTIEKSVIEKVDIPSKKVLR